MKEKKYLTPVIVIAAFLGGLLLNSGGRLFQTNLDSSAQPASSDAPLGAPDRLNQLSLKLNAKYWRGLDKNDFSLYYEPVAPDTIRLKVRYKPGADVNFVRSVAYSAQELITHVASDDFGLSISTTIDMAQIENNN